MSSQNIISTCFFHCTTGTSIGMTYERGTRRLTSCEVPSAHNQIIASSIFLPLKVVQTRKLVSKFRSLEVYKLPNFLLKVERELECQWTDVILEYFILLNKITMVVSTRTIRMLPHVDDKELAAIDSTIL